MKSMNNVITSEHQLVNVLHIIMNCHTSYSRRIIN